MIADEKTGTVHFLFCQEYMRAFYSRSVDDGKTFSTPQEITSAFEELRPKYDWKVLAIGPGHGIQHEERSSAGGDLAIVGNGSHGSPALRHFYHLQRR